MNRFLLLLTAVIILSALTTCSTELLEEITTDIEAYVASKLPQKPEIEISADGAELFSGYGFYNFPGKSRIDIEGSGGNPVSKTFVVSNLGDGELTFSVSLSGADAGSFALDTSGMLTTLESASTGTSFTTFTVDFDPVESGTVAAVVTVTNNDEDEPTYTFTVSGTAEWWGFQELATVGNVSTLSTFGSILVIPESTFLDGDEILVTYSNLTDGEVMIMRSTDGGASWSDPETVVAGNSGWKARYSSLAIDGDTVYLAYQYYYDSGSITGELRMKTSPDRGYYWGADIGELVTDSVWEPGHHPSICIDSTDQMIYIAHYEGFNKELRLSKKGISESASAWVTSVVDDTSGDIGEYVSLQNIGEVLYSTVALNPALDAMVER